MKSFVILFIAVFTIVSRGYSQSEKSFQLSFITPLSTNGASANKIANDYSINLLGGYSRANNVFEFGGLYNINSEYTKGVQFAGLTNISSKGVKAIQFAGLANVTSNQEGGIQISGISNVASKGNVGAQVGGILNVAKNAGTQIGLINIADSVGGASIGLINIVKKNGKQEFELGFSDAINTYLSFKLGTDKFYTIFSGGINFYDIKNTETKAPAQFLVGLGFGKEIHFKKSFATQFELMGYAVTEDKEFTGDLNLLSQFKLTVSKELSSGLKFYVGPVFNMTISQYKNAEGELVGTNIAPYTIFQDNNGKTALKGWIGLSLGIRY